MRLMTRLADGENGIDPLDCAGLFNESIWLNTYLNRQSIRLNMSQIDPVDPIN